MYPTAGTGALIYLTRGAAVVPGVRRSSLYENAAGEYRNSVKEVTVMYCPRCATPNADDVKFCRSCGAELEALALALSGKPVQPIKSGANKGEPETARDWLEKHIESVSGITRGAILLAVSLLLGVAMALFLPGSFEVPWILIWMVFFGWMAVWGGIETAYGVSGVLESKSRLRLLGLEGKGPVDGAIPQQLIYGGEPPNIAGPSSGFRPSHPVNVTEGTTRHLDDYAEK